MSCDVIPLIYQLLVAYYNLLTLFCTTYSQSKYIFGILIYRVQQSFSLTPNAVVLNLIWFAVPLLSRYSAAPLDGHTGMKNCAICRHPWQQLPASRLGVTALTGESRVISVKY